MRILSQRSLFALSPLSVSRYMFVFLAGYDFCSEGHSCMENSVCRSLNDRAVCSCRDGFRALREDSAYCEGSPCHVQCRPMSCLGLLPAKCSTCPGCQVDGPIESSEFNLKHINQLKIIIFQITIFQLSAICQTVRLRWLVS